MQNLESRSTIKTKNSTLMKVNDCAKKWMKWDAAIWRHYTYIYLYMYLTRFSHCIILLVGIHNGQCICLQIEILREVYIHLFAVRNLNLMWKPAKNVMTSSPVAGHYIYLQTRDLKSRGQYIYALLFALRDIPNIKIASVKTWDWYVSEIGWS